MPNDAKLGMVFGVVLVILIAALFFRKDSNASGSAEGTLVAANNASPPAPAPDPKNRGLRKHRVQEGETLAQLAQRYLNDDSRTADFRRANPGAIPDNGELSSGQELVIPDALPSGELPH